ncbi:RecQ family ATP-dependent DNA helicase [Alkalibacillus aidingensis]|uniref:RecQ family ATP-dependent DNA helicase n=1 Tax=Alkalibacillus aidingensis TaxID=2747607 RepID=UPI0016602701|nr:ATP-dependent DNA helicase RecQ [Alkalibacillus aidingensis]
MYKTKDTLEEALNIYFGFSTFRQGQKEIISSIMKGNHTLATLPTGSGKSICYQLPALLGEGVTVVISPLISLMVDQVKILKSKGIKRVAALNSLMNHQQKQQVLTHLQQYKIVFCSPEMMQQEFVLNKLKGCHINYLVVDEAHCISQWGHEFRPDYLKIKQVHNQLGEPTLLALSATATPEVQADIVKHLNLDMHKIIYPMDRENITFAVKHLDIHEDKVEALENLLSNNHVPTMIYFSSRKVCEEVSRLLQGKFPDKSVSYYHGGMEQEDRLLIQQQFMYDQLDIICCTSAFGMGVDKPNIRLVIHFHIPPTIESYIQEVGRAGRDGYHCVALLLYQKGDESLPFQLIGNELPEDEEIEQFPFQEDSSYLKELLSETKHRFLTFQFDQWHQLGFTTDDAISKIKSLRDERLAVKRNSIITMVNWIKTDSCRRKMLYQGFQDSFSSPLSFCCDQCDFDIDQWNWKEEKRSKGIELNWEERLRILFNRR